jgi:TolB-like protein/Flp pilus assembly protein TadD
LASLDELMRRVWPGIVVSPETVSQRIKLLRDALGDEPREPRYIGGLRGRGYQMIAAVKELGAEPAATAVEPSDLGVQVSTSRPDMRRNRLMLIGLFVVALVAAGWLLAGRFWIAHQKPTSGTAAVVVVAQKSIAVLPFVDMSEKKDQEYFSDGMSEELIDMLTKIPDLRVPARTSSFYFKGKPATIAEIANALSVLYVLEGSVRKSGTTLRVTAQLIRADDGYHLWSETYDRNLGDVFRVQDEIAGEVIKVLKLKLLDGEAPHAASTGNVDAYTLRLRARFFRNRGQVGDIQKAVDLYRRVVQLDPDSAIAWAELADVLRAYSYNSQAIPWKEGREQALDAANRSLTLDPLLPQAHDAVAWIRYIDWDWTGAQAAYERARAVDPTFESYVAPSLAVTLGDLPKAAQLQERIVMRDPVDKNPYLKLAYIYIRQGRLSEAEAAVRKAKELSPTGVGIPITLGEILVRRGETQAGLAEIQQDPDETNRVWKSAWAYQYLGRKHDADVALGRLIAMDAGPSGLALLYAMRGERDVAFDWLERAYNQHDDRLLYILDHNPDMKNLREDPRWKAFLKKMNLSEG